MACPFSGRGIKLTHRDDNGSEGDDCKLAKIRQDELAKALRQSSVQITSSLLGEDGDDLEDTQTLNLKHLRAAVILLTKPSVLNKRRFYFFSFRYRRIHNPHNPDFHRSVLYHCSACISSAC